MPSPRGASRPRDEPGLLRLLHRRVGSLPLAPPAPLEFAPNIETLRLSITNKHPSAPQLRHISRNAPGVTNFPSVVLNITHPSSTC